MPPPGPVNPMLKRKYLLAGWLGSAVMAAIGQAAPQPSLVPKSWELTFRYRDPERIAVTVPGRAEPVVYWYMLYTVENPGEDATEFRTGDKAAGDTWSRVRFTATEARAGEAPKFYPIFSIVTDTLQVVRSEIGVSPEAFRAIQRRWNDPLLLSSSQITGKLLIGKDRARHGVAIWPDIDPNAREMTVYISGLSGETQRIPNPAFDAARPVGPENPRMFILYKTLAVPYRLPGGPGARASAVPHRLSREPQWVMR